MDPIDVGDTVENLSQALEYWISLMCSLFGEEEGSGLYASYVGFDSAAAALNDEEEEASIRCKRGLATARCTSGSGHDSADMAALRHDTAVVAHG